MSTYVVGDVQGCFASLVALAETLDFDRARDQMWLVGDLVNRGPHNIEVLRWVRALGDRARVVLGNHDLHLLARATGVSAAKHLDTIEDVLEAPDRDELVEWLRHQPVAFRQGDDLIVHAGVLPSWSDDDIDEHARELEAALQSDRFAEVLAALAAGRETPLVGASGDDRLAAISAVFQRVRTVDADERVIDHSGAPADAPPGCEPWFARPHRRRPGTRVLFGHWSALGLHVQADAIGLDTGCVWGRELTAYCLESGELASVTAR